MTAAFAVTLVVLSEDSGHNGWSSLHLIARKTLDMVVSNLDWEHGVEITPRDAVPEAVQRICAGNGWRSASPADVPRKGELFRYVARLLDEGTERPQFVLFHVDGDCVWAEGRRGPSLNLRQFDDVVCTGVRRALTERSKIRRSDQELKQVMERLSVIAPHYEIEAWLYQSTRRARELCRSRPCAGRHAPQYDAWEQDRGALDEVEQIKKQATLSGMHCLSDDDKDHLAREFPADAVFAAQKSYAAWVGALMNDAALMEALGRAQYPRG